MKFALAGNQNCGKTALFNALTGMNCHVGNFPGVTVEQKNGRNQGQERLHGYRFAGNIFAASVYAGRNSYH